MVLALLEHLPVVVPRNLREKTLKLHKVSYPSAFPSGTGKPVVDNWCGFSDLRGCEGLTDMDVDDYESSIAKLRKTRSFNQGF